MSPGGARENSQWWRVCAHHWMTRGAAIVRPGRGAGESGTPAGVRTMGGPADPVVLNTTGYSSARLWRVGFRALHAQKTKAMLAITSVAIGVAAVILTGAVSAGAQREITARVAAIGSNLIVVRPATVARTPSRNIAGVVNTLTIDDYEAVARMPLVAAASPGIEKPLRVKSGNRIVLARVLGVSKDYPHVRNFRVQAGRFFDRDDETQKRRVAVLGSEIAEGLFEGRDPVGQEIRARGIPFDVIGVLESKGVLPDGSNEDNEILIPSATALRRVVNRTWLTSIFISVRDASRIDETREQIAGLVRARHGREDFGIQNTAKLMTMQKEAASLLGTLGAGLGGVALALGGIGILALMLMSVKQRTGEIGLRMALGATPRNILTQFLFEGTLLAIGGWLVGLTIGGIGAMALRSATEWQLGWPVKALLESAAMVLVAGLGFSAFPARRAARLQPMEALRAQ